jgi:hypothetical protein
MEEGGFCGNATRGEFNDRRDEGAASGWVADAKITNWNQ